MKILRTPDSAFENVKNYPFEPNYTTIQTHDGSELRIHHVDEDLKMAQFYWPCMANRLGVIYTAE